MALPVEGEGTGSSCGHPTSARLWVVEESALEIPGATLRCWYAKGRYKPHGSHLEHCEMDHTSLNETG